MSTGAWRPESCPDGHREDAPLEAALQDQIAALLGQIDQMEETAARLRTVARRFGGVSRLVREVELRGKRRGKSAAPVQEQAADFLVAS